MARKSRSAQPSQRCVPGNAGVQSRDEPPGGASSAPVWTSADDAAARSGLPHRPAIVRSEPAPRGHAAVRADGASGPPNHYACRRDSVVRRASRRRICRADRHRSLFLVNPSPLFHFTDRATWLLLTLEALSGGAAGTNRGDANAGAIPPSREVVDTHARREDRRPVARDPRSRPAAGSAAAPAPRSPNW